MSPTKYLSEDEYRVLREKLTLEPNLLLELLIATGARVSEVLGIRVQDINHDNASVFIRGLKGSYDREMPLSKDMYYRLVNRSELKRSSQRVFDQTYRQVHYAWECFRPFPKKLHSLRHTYAIRAYKKEKDILAVKEALGHKDFKSTMVYMSAVNSVDSRRRFLD